MFAHKLITSFCTLLLIIFVATGQGRAEEPAMTAEGQAIEVNFKAADGVEVFADFYMSGAGKSAPLIILFHQAGSDGSGEYGPIIPKLTAHDYNVLVVDQRSGGTHFGSNNRTVDAQGKNTKFCAAYPDMEAALLAAKDHGFTGPRFVWGSSYSAALVLKLGIEYADDITGVLSFSPGSGSAMGPCNANNYVNDIITPTLALSPRNEMKGRKAQFAILDAKGHETFVAEKGVHGSSMLVEARTNSDTSATWSAVFDFLSHHSAP